jgi:two-component system, NtrC family, response regulator HydG
MSVLTDEQLTTQIARRIALPPAASARWTVVVLDGAEQDRRFSIDDVVTRRVLIGQSPACDVQIADRSISRRHAVLESDANGVRIVDVGARNGIFIGGIRVRDAYLRSGEIVRFGDVQLRFESDGAIHAIPTSNEACFGHFVGASPEVRALHPLFQRIAETDVALLIEGETGTGKEVLAESIHERSGRASGPFVVLDCTTVAATLLEAELFGHERGAFTGASTDRRGLFEEASGGTLFIDEIGDLDPSLQTKLLRAIERKEIRRVGGSAWLRFDVRVIAATRRDLDREVAARRFRDDLFYRLAVARVELPPLRRRQGDVAFLTRFFWNRLGGDERDLAPDVLQRFEAHGWPGNVRELANAVARQLAVGDLDATRLARAGAGLPEAPPGSGADFLEDIVRAAEPMTLARQKVVDEFERRYTRHMLDLHGGNVTRAAAASGIGRRYFQMVRAKRPT